MKIGLIMHPYGEKRPSGLGTSVFDLYRALIENGPENTYRIFLKGRHEEHPQFKSTNYEVVELNDGFFWLEGLRKHKDVNAFLFPMPFLPYFHTPRNAVVIIRDFGHRHIPASNSKGWIQNKMLPFINKRAFKHAVKIAAISQGTKHELIQLYPGISKEKIVVIYNGHRNFSTMREEVVDIPDRPFFLTVGVIKERKNILRSVTAFAEFKKTDTKNHQYILVGKRGGEYGERIEQLIEKKQLQNDVVFADYLTDGQVAYLYHHATAVVYASLLEGFGKPILEAMDCGAPVITSDEGALKEVAGDSALLVNPRDPEDIASAMTRIATQKNLGCILIKKGKERAQDFSWEKAGKEYARIINEIGNE